MGGGGKSGSAGGTAQTPEERRGSIDRRLDDSLGTFDDRIRREQEAIAKERDARDAANGSGAGSTTDAETTSDDSGTGSAGTETPPSTDNKKAGDGSAKEGTAADRSSRPGDLKSEKQRGAGKDNSGSASGGAAGSKQIPDGSNDDIVARRLRKAAEQETDPELKEKLWKEYIEYKKNNG
jgi:hypothetical protein